MNEPGMERIPRVLFLCAGNSARSIMAEAVARALGKGALEVSSAGIRPAGMSPLTISVLEDAGFETAGLRSKPVEELEGIDFDLIVMLGDSAGQECPGLHGGAERRHWNLPDPSAAQGDESSRLHVFRDVLEQVRRRVADLVDSFKPRDVGSAGPERQKGETRIGTRHLSPREAYEAATTAGAVVIDIRPEHETNYRVFDVPEVLIIPRTDLQERVADIPRERPLILADAVGLWVKESAEALREAGFGSVACLAGGMVEWERDGMPVKKDLDYELRGQCGCKLRSRGKKSSSGAGDPGKSDGRKDGA